jgi:hypothetical protein
MVGCGSSPPATGGHAGSGGGASGAAGSSGSAGASGDAGTSGEAGTSGGAGTTGDAGAGGGAAEIVGPSGGTVSMGGVSLLFPTGALAADAPITVAPTSMPPGYEAASAAYQFGPDGTTFAQPITVSIPLSASAPAGVHLFWSNANGGFDDIGGTVSGTTLVGKVMHFSVGFAALPKADSTTDGGGVAMDARADGGSGSSSDGGAGASSSDGGAAGASGGGDASAPVDASASGSGGASSDGAAASDGAAGSTGMGGGDASAGVDAAALCSGIPFNAPVVSPMLVNDGSSAPAGSTYTGGTLPTGQYYMSSVIHYGATYSGGTSQILKLDTTAKTLQLAERTAGTVYYLGLVNVTNADAHTLVGDVVCSTYPQAQPAQLSWYYTLGQKLAMSQAGSADVKSYIVPAVP